MYQHNSKVSGGYNNPKSLKNLSKLAKKGLKILYFWTTWAIWCWYAQTTSVSFTKLSIQVLKVKAFLQAEFWIPASIFITVFPQKILKKCSKNPKYVFFDHIRYSVTIRIMKFGMKRHVLHMNPHKRF